MEHITVDSSVAIVAVVGQSMRGVGGFIGRTFKALDRENVSVIAVAQGSTECTLSLVVAKKDTKAALTSIHPNFNWKPSNSMMAESRNAYLSLELADQSQLVRTVNGDYLQLCNSQRTVSP